MDLSENNRRSNFSDKILLGFTYLNSYWFLSFFASGLFYWAFFIISIIIIIIIIKIIAFFIDFWDTAVYIIIKIILIIIVIISFIFFCRFFLCFLLLWYVIFRFGTPTAFTICGLFFIVPFSFSSFKKFLLFSVVIY